MEEQATKRTPEEKISALMGGSISGGLSCPNCGCCDLRVLDKRDNAPGQIYRRRICRHCGERFSTTERINHQ